MSPWDKFFQDKINKIFSEKKLIIDIGGGLRISKEKSNRFDPARAWIVPLAEKTEYKIMDPVADFHPDIVGDIHKMPFGDNSIDAIICLAVLEHVENPILAMSEIHRVLKPGGYCLIYVPFLFYYHAEKGYYHDYWRFTKDILQHLSKSFTSSEIQNVRGAVGTWLHLSPFGRVGIVRSLARMLDRIIGKTWTKQTSGYNMFLIK